MKQVLILNITRMGDLIQMGPLLARLREEQPGVAIDVVVDRQFALVASMLDGLREVISFDFHELIDSSRASVKDTLSLYQEVAGWARPMRDRRYDRIVNLTFNRPSAFLAGYVGAADIRGGRSAWDGGVVIDNAWMAYFTDIHHSRRINRFNLVDVYALGGSGPGTFAPLHVTLPGESRDWARRFLASEKPEAAQWIAVQAGASDIMKAWRPAHFGAALAALSARWKGGVLFIGAPSERETIAQVIQAYRGAGGRNPFINAAGRTSLEQLAALLAESRLLLTNDTGPMHMAVAVKTPVVDLSVGHVDFRETGPYGAGHWVVQPDLDCAPCGFEQVCAHHSCKDRLVPNQMADLMLHVLGSGPFPAGISQCRVYESGIDEDRLGTFRLRAGREALDAEWYGTFWRRYWYHAFTGSPSHVPVPEGPAPDTEMALNIMAMLTPKLDSLCRRAEDIVNVARCTPIAVPTLRALQQEQSQERESAVSLGMTTLATAPLTTECVRAIHNDNVQGMELLARHHARAYRQWRDQLAGVRRYVSEAGRHACSRRARHHARAYRQWRDQLAGVRRYVSEAGRHACSRRLPMIGRSHMAYVKGGENASIS
ncbi:MAG: glycosyltransferase family 9 protein [Nitrospira sp.]|nr:glycosyltransferase family 9 protein [Nitrospira sp.]